jgi:hypothetical protein
VSLSEQRDFSGEVLWCFAFDESDNIQVRPSEKKSSAVAVLVACFDSLRRGVPGFVSAAGADDEMDSPCLRVVYDRKRCRFVRQRIESSARD